jgi:hypothetical protein
MNNYHPVRLRSLGLRGRGGRRTVCVGTCLRDGGLIRRSAVDGRIRPHRIVTHDLDARGPRLARRLAHQYQRIFLSSLLRELQLENLSVI